MTGRIWSWIRANWWRAVAIILAALIVIPIAISGALHSCVAQPTAQSVARPATPVVPANAARPAVKVTPAAEKPYINIISERTTGAPPFEITIEVVGVFDHKGDLTAFTLQDMNGRYPQLATKGVIRQSSNCKARQLNPNGPCLNNVFTYEAFPKMRQQGDNSRPNRTNANRQPRRAYR